MSFSVSPLARPIFLPVSLMQTFAPRPSPKSPMILCAIAHCPKGGQGHEENHDYQISRSRLGGFVVPRTSIGLRHELVVSYARILTPLTESSSVACPASSSHFAFLWSPSVSDLCLYPFSHLCLPSCDSLQCWLQRLGRYGAFPSCSRGQVFIRW